MIILINGMIGTHIETLGKYISIDLNDSELKNFYEFNITPNEIEFKILEDFADFPDKYSDDIPENIVTPPTVSELVTQPVFIGRKMLFSYMFDKGYTNFPELFADDVVDYKIEGVNYSPRTATQKHDGKDLVICGQMGKFYIDEIIKLVGAENVKVYNIIRNPVSSHYVYEQKVNALSYHAKIYDVFNALLLSELDYVTTYKFEDIMDSGSININGSDIELTSHCSMKSMYFATFEANHPSLGPKLQSIASSLTELQSFYSSLNMIDHWLSSDDVTEETFRFYTERTGQEIPRSSVNLLNALNY